MAAVLLSTEDGQHDGNGCQVEGYADEIMLFFIGIASLIVLSRAVLGRETMEQLFGRKEMKGIKYKMMPRQSSARRRRSYRALQVILSLTKLVTVKRSCNVDRIGHIECAHCNARIPHETSENERLETEVSRPHHSFDTNASYIIDRRTNSSTDTLR